MRKIQTFRTAEDFRKSLEQKIASKAKELNQDLERVRRKIAFERFLARLFSEGAHQWLLKGGYAMELRFEIARATKDIDLMIIDYKKFIRNDMNSKILEALREDASRDLEDYFEFNIQEPKFDLKLPIYGGARFPVETLIGGRRFVKFNLDVGMGDISADPIEEKVSEGWLSGFGLSQITYKLINPEQQFAEKLHAYTFPREGRKNSRVKDIVDLILLIKSNKLNSETLSEVIQKVFTRRNTHLVPSKLENPPDEWESTFGDLVKTCGIQSSLDEGFQVVREYFEKFGR